MQIRFRPRTAPELLEPRDFLSLKVLACDFEDEHALQSAIQDPMVEFQAGDAELLVSPDWLLRLGESLGRSWADRALSMIDGAAKHGWVDQRGWVRIHIERS